MTRHTQITRLTLAAILFAATPAYADEAEPEQSWTLQFENDLFSQYFGLTGSDDTDPNFDGDRDYTTGLRLGVTMKRDKPLPLFDWLDSITLLKPRQKKKDPGPTLLLKQLFIGQNLYTPTDITQTAPQPEDRPYAAWLYVGGSASRQTTDDFEVIELDVGVIGPMALGREVQTLVHNIVNTRHPEGWDNQLPNEPGFVFTYMRAHHMHLIEPKSHDESDFGVDITPHTTLALGTVYTYAGAGGTVRLGWGRDREIVTPNRIQPSMPGTDWFSPGKLTGYLFAGAEGRYVARNAFLDGTIFSDSQSVDKRNWVADLVVGAVVFAGDWRFAYTHAFRTEEFHNQKGGQFFGSMSVTRLF